MNYIWPRVQIANGHDVTNWDIINDKSTVEKLTLTCMRRHFAQSQGTPFTEDYWIQAFSDKKIQEQILNGDFNLSSFPEPVRLYLQALRRKKSRK